MSPNEQSAYILIAQPMNLASDDAPRCRHAPPHDERALTGTTISWAYLSQVNTPLSTKHGPQADLLARGVFPQRRSADSSIQIPRASVRDPCHSAFSDGIH